MKRGPKIRPIIDRLMAKTTTDRETGCILWAGALTSNGYGKVGTSDGGTERAHRVVWRELRGPIPDSLCVLHKCDVRRCVNPEHLFLGTKKDNTHDMMRKGRHVPGKGGRGNRDTVHAKSNIPPLA
jgi:hypothetical protein